MVVEPAAADDVAGNLNPVGRVYDNFSAQLILRPAVHPERAVADWRVRARRAGGRGRHPADRDGRRVHRFRRATETPFNIVYEVRP